MAAPSSLRSRASEEVKRFFHYPCHSVITRSALEGYMGRVTVRGSSADSSLAARIDLGVFRVLAGCPNEEPTQGAAHSAVVVPVQPTWAPLIRLLLPLHTAYKRDLMEVAPGGFPVRRLQQLVDACPAGYTIVPITEAIAADVAKEEWSADLTGNFDDAATFVRVALGFVAIEDSSGFVAAGASTFALCDAGIEVEVDTAEAHQRRGLARVCSAHLILACLERGWQAGWDAHVPHSAVLAERLGYVVGTPYVAYTTDPLAQL
ncbi:hypothetical protein ABB37_04378 [Leptomonas pyrrhocoris]|uniref:N-acetyltransferase domain-containing protein n=1 Tax=Leptomonas pyrrhocoris TaxID=157538 RepID=A0A0M9G2P4_LEPPY|nr:hypothetical protein ABB37_04378 [Leptomonas pyrrhocoris]XP_015659436.1 hypothetical protein ABB37_04378 [Leptomonas pyrrhocoris]KPA80996.1 hypothetical protein ABB37_04378 [Leptomonas pyrrhocoris]KPA80997.1 hypothetical protein ABB37_04378 [Leptomonas pyrrhocoris]|eukprot:XP_015659435.1 hypothetical protein ABB37_04378 [Leptomonas pyrrhocoris]